MSGVVYSGDWLQHHNKMIESGFEVDRIIADIPSFPGRWRGANGIQGLGTIRDLVSATCRAAEKMIVNDGTFTVSCTGIAQEKLNEWVASDAFAANWELMPDSTWAMFRPYIRKVSTNKHFWGRRDDWTFVQTFRKKGSSATLNRTDVKALTGADTKEGWPMGIFDHRQAFSNFNYPSSMNDVEVSAFRAPYHKGEHEAKEKQKCLGKNGITYEEVQTPSGLKVVAQLGSDAHFTDGYVVQFGTDPKNWYHLPKRITELAFLGLDGKIADMFYHNKYKGCATLAGGNHKHVMLSMFILSTHTKEGDRVLDPFCGFGSMGAACAITGRDFIGVEMNKTRKDIAQNAYDELKLQADLSAKLGGL